MFLYPVFLISLYMLVNFSVIFGTEVEREINWDALDWETIASARPYELKYKPVLQPAVLARSYSYGKGYDSDGFADDEDYFNQSSVQAALGNYKPTDYDFADDVYSDDSDSDDDDYLGSWGASSASNSSSDAVKHAGSTAAKLKSETGYTPENNPDLYQRFLAYNALQHKITPADVKLSGAVDLEILDQMKEFGKIADLYIAISQRRLAAQKKLRTGLPLDVWDEIALAGKIE